MANLFFNNLHGSGAGEVAVKNGTDTVSCGVADDYSKVIVKKTTSAGVETVYEAPLYATGEMPQIFTGSAANAAAVYAEVGTVDAVGSLYLSTAGGMYFQVADAGAATDWETVTTT